jgi:hypothetical protein
LIQLPAIESAPIAVAARMNGSTHRQSRTEQFLKDSPIYPISVFFCKPQPQLQMGNGMLIGS